jgi:tetratricopeptide (TPR) repeat protein
MYGHDLRLVGRIDEAIAQFQKANDLEAAYYKDQEIPARYDWHRIHNLDLMSGSYEFKGQIGQAEELLRQSFTLPANDGLFASYQCAWPRFLLSRGRYTEALAAAGQMANGKFSLQRSMGLLYAARALVALNRLDEAQQKMNEAEKERENVPETDPEPLMPQPRTLLAGPFQILRGEIALHKGNKEEADSVLDEVLHRFGSASRSGDAVGHLFAMLYIAQQARSFEDWGLVERAGAQMLSFDPNYAGGHYIAALVAEHKGDSAVARRELTAGQALWSHADTDLPELADIHKKLAAAP